MGFNYFSELCRYDVSIEMRKKLKIASYYLLVIILYYVLFQAFYNKVAYKTVWPYASVGKMLNGVALNFTPILVTFILNIVIIFYLNRIKDTVRKIVIDAILSFIAMVGINLIYSITVVPIVDWAGTIFNNVFLFLGVEVAYYIRNFERKTMEVTEKEKLALQYQYDALKAQVNPHFLFNSLNILYSLVSIDQQKSKEFILALSKMYRYIMSLQGKNTVPVKEEVDFLNSYVDVLSMRYHNQLEVCIKGTKKITNQRMVPYTMQLLMENVVKHNVISHSHHMTVAIDIDDDHLNISNPIIPRPSDSVSHVGLNYLANLYRHHGKEFKVLNDGKTFTAIVPFINSNEDSNDS